MTERHDEQEGLTQALRPDEIAAEGATELPDREAMSLIGGPGGGGPLPILTQPLGPTTPDTFGEAPTTQATPMPIAQDVGPAS